MSPLNRRFALLCLYAALAAPALILLPRTAHPFDVGPGLALPVLALLAAGLAWRERGAPLSRAWAWGLGALALAWGGFALLGLPFAMQATAWDPRPQVELWQRATLLLPGLLLAYDAGRRTPPPGMPPALYRAGLGLVALWFIAGALSLRPDQALETLWGWGAYPLVFAAAWMLAARREDRTRLAWLLLGVGALNAAYGLLQALGQDPLAWNRSFSGRAIGFMGNPNFLGGHLALLLPLAAALALDQRERRWRSARWGVAVLLLLGLLLTQTRGAWVGALLGLALLGWLLRRRSPELFARHRRGLGVALGLALGLVALYMALQPQAGRRVLDLLQGRDVEGGRRAFLMAKAWQLSLRHPALGVGPGNFRVWFPSVQVQGIAPEALATQPYVISEHSHNDLLQMAADAGWPAAFLWLAVLALLARHLWRGLAPGRDLARAQPEGLLQMGVLAGLAALSVHGLANFPFLILPTQATAWALAAVGLRSLAGAEAAEERAEAAPRRLGAVPSLLLLVALALAALGLRSRMMLKEQFWWMGEGELGLGNTQLASPTLLRALDFDRREDRLWRLHGRSEFDKGLIWNSIGSLREAVRLNPYDAEAAVRLGRALVENKIHDEAEAVLGKVALYAPNFVDVWEPLAAALYQQQKYADAVKAYDWMLFFRVNEEAAYANKAAALGGLGQLPQALLTLKQAEQKMPLNGKIQLNLAITYLKLGLKPEAKAAWRKAAELSPSDPQVDQLRTVLR